MKIKIIHFEEYIKFEEELANLYIDAFSTGQSFQYHNRKETLNYLRSIFDVGYGIFAFENDKLAGVILLTPLAFDRLVPDEITQLFDVTRSVYVVEMMVEKSEQGHGIGKKLLRSFLKTVNKEIFHHAFIRVWVENESALGLYKKMGFEICASIVQPRMLADKSGMFNFKKIYLHQKLE